MRRFAFRRRRAGAPPRRCKPACSCSPPNNTNTKTDPPRPFDFLIDGELVRRSLEQHLLQRGKSLEQAVEVEYVPAVPPPAPRGAPTAPQDDWVSCVAALSGGSAGPLLATGCYDGVVRLWQAGAGLQQEEAQEEREEEGSSQLLPSVEAAGAFFAHKGGVTAAASAGPGAGSGGASLLATAGKDHAARLWRVEQQQQAPAAGGRKKATTTTTTTTTTTPPTTTTTTARQLAELTGHTDTIEALAVSSSGGGGGDPRRCATGGWDGQLLVWRCGRELERAAADEPAGAAAPAKKRRVVAKRGGGDGERDDDHHPVRAAPLVERPLARLALAESAAAASAASASSAAGGHCVSALAWPSRASLYSGAYDHSVRRWDVEAGVAVASCPTSRPVLSLAAPVPLMVAGGGGGDDDEDGAGGGGHVVAFGSADGVLRLWDARAGPQVALAASAGQPASVAAGATAADASSGAAAARVVSSSSSSPAAWLPSVAWRPGSLHHVATASHDGAVRLFDLRTAVPLGKLAGLHGGGSGGEGGGKALCVAWWRPEGAAGGVGGGVPRFLASGGTDCRLRVSALPAGCGDGIL
jgi:ribosome biogenesis protein